jgi:hypothetical protein
MTHQRGRNRCADEAAWTRLPHDDDRHCRPGERRVEHDQQQDEQCDEDDDLEQVAKPPVAADGSSLEIPPRISAPDPKAES